MTAAGATLAVSVDTLRSVLTQAGERVLDVTVWSRRDQLTIFDCTTERGSSRLVAEPFDERITVGVTFDDAGGRKWSVWPFPHDSRIPGMSVAFLGTAPPFDRIRPSKISRYFPDVPRCVMRAQDADGAGYYVKCYGDPAAYEQAKCGHQLWSERVEPREFVSLDEVLTVIVPEIDAHDLQDCLDGGHLDAAAQNEVRAEITGLVDRLNAAGLTYVDFHRRNVLVSHADGAHRLHLIDLDAIRAL